MTATAAPPSLSGPHLRQPQGDPVLRPAPGLTVLLGAPSTYTVAGYLLRHGEALALMPSVPQPAELAGAFGPVPVLASEPGRRAQLDAEVRAAAAEAADRAGWTASRAETIAPAALHARLAELEPGQVGCVVQPGGGAGAARRIARAAGAPVFVLPDGAAPAGGPAVFDARDAALVVRPAARCLATERTVAVAAWEPVPRGTLEDAAGSPAIASRLHSLARTHGKAAREEAERCAGRAGALAEDQSFEVETLVAPRRRGLLLDLATAREGILVVADRGGVGGAPGLRAALRRRRPVLLVPA